jgi:signal transduction histidine kinase
VNKAPARLVARLPRLSSGTSEWQLPLSDYASHELARGLVTHDLAAREAGMAELMSVDPPLALWTACRAAGAGAAAPRCVLDLARWLAACCLSALTWPAPEEAGERPLRELPARWRELSADAVAVASLAADQAADDRSAAEAYLLGLLHNAADWLRSCGPRISLARSDGNCLPHWLVELLGERSRPSRCATMQLVLQAVTLWREAGRRGRHVGGADVTDAALARKRWQACRGEESGPGRFLPVLTARLRQLAQLEQQFEQAVEHAKLLSLGELAYGASHEINNPLANISTRAQALLIQESDPEKRRMLAIINSQAFRANEMIADMMLFARPPALVYQRVDLGALVDSVLSELQEDAQLQGSCLTRQGDTGAVWIEADPTQLATAIRAVCVNALEALIAEGRVDVAVEQVPPPPGEAHAWARIAIRDTGPGIPAHVRPHIFDPFFSGREAGRGLGFGLSKCWRVVTLHAGRLDVTSVERQGTTFTIELPMTSPQS